MSLSDSYDDTYEASTQSESDTTEDSYFDVEMMAVFQDLRSACRLGRVGNMVTHGKFVDFINDNTDGDYQMLCAVDSENRPRHFLIEKKQ